MPPNDQIEASADSTSKVASTLWIYLATELDTHRVIAHLRTADLDADWSVDKWTA